MKEGLPAQGATATLELAVGPVAELMGDRPYVPAAKKPMTGEGDARQPPLLP